MFWRYEDYPAVLRARVDTLPPTPTSGAIHVHGLRCRRSILVTPDGRQSILLSTDGGSVQILCEEGPSVLDGSAALTFLISRADDLHVQIDALTRFTALCRQADPGDPPRVGAADPSRQAQQLRNCLIALDGSLADASYRQIAEALYGKDIVAREWINPSRSLKDWTRYAVRRGRELMNGKYRDFLKR